MPHACRSHIASTLAAGLLAACLLSACGGGGDSPSAAPVAVVAVAPAASAASAAAAAPTNVLATLSGVAAFGAPLSGATLKVIDAKGRAVGTTSTNQADGSYTLALALGGTAPTMPLLVQAAGFDATGLPLLLHSAVPSVSTTATSVVVNITPLTDAAVALTLGAEPRRVFAQPTGYTTQLAALATLAPASDFVKGLVKTNLTDAKVASTTTLDLFADSSFTATKVGVDLALETLSIGYGVSNARRDVLQLGNKLGAKQVEVTVDLATAATELAKTTGAAPASAITSTLKLTTSPTTVVTRLPALDTLAVAINTAVAAGGSGSAVTALSSSYVRHNGRDTAALAALIAGWAQQGTQLGRLQVTGCADLPSTSTTTTTTTITIATCAKVAVAARLTDTAGKETGSFSDVVTYSTTTSRWSLVGNGLPAAVTARATSWLSLNADGSKTTSALVGNPRTGIQLGVQNNTVGNGVASATVLTPSNYVLTLVQCAQTWLCISPMAGASSTVATATPGDQSVFQGTSVWMGVADTAVGATYSFTLTPTSGSTTITLPVALRNGFLDGPADARFPVLDGIKADAPLSGATLLFGTTLAWQTWAAANPDMRVTMVRLVLANANNSGDSTGTPLVYEAKPARWQASTLDWAAVEVPQDFALGSVTLWLLAIDSSGREVATGYVVVAP